MTDQATDKKQIDPMKMAILLKEVAASDAHLSFYIEKVKPFIDKYKSEHDDDMPTWDILDANQELKKGFGKKTAQLWFKTLVDKYGREFKNKEKTQKNASYDEDIAVPLSTRYNMIREKSGMRVRTARFSKEKAKQIADLL